MRIAKRRRSLPVAVTLVVIGVLSFGSIVVYSRIEQKTVSGTVEVEQTADKTLPDLSDGHDALDVSYAGARLIYHQQAIELSNIALERSSSSAVLVFAEQVKNSETTNANSYIELLNKWGEKVLNLWDYPEVDGCRGYPLQVGMASPADIRELKTLSGVEFDDTYLNLLLTYSEKSEKLIEHQNVKNRELYLLDAKSVKYHRGNTKAIQEMPL